MRLIVAVDCAAGMTCVIVNESAAAQVQGNQPGIAPVSADIQRTAKHGFVANESSAADSQRCALCIYSSAVCFRVTASNISAGNLNNTVSTFINFLRCAFSCNRCPSPVIQCYVVRGIWNTVDDYRIVGETACNTEYTAFAGHPDAVAVQIENGRLAVSEFDGLIGFHIIQQCQL